MKNLILVGFMGCGKSTIGKMISEKTGFLFIDSDEKIEENKGKSIKDIFASEGENAFRAYETEFLNNLCDKAEPFVLSAGGGMPVYNNNGEIMKRAGSVVYLKASPETIYDHIKDDTTRPLLMCQDKIGKIRKLMALREEYYSRSADVVINIDNKDAAKVCEEVLNYFK